MGGHRSLMLALFQLHAYLIQAREAAQYSVERYVCLRNAPALVDWLVSTDEG